jgi:hypothetical protein
VEKKDGGPAFPGVLTNYQLATGQRTVETGQNGMSLRDYFAGQALIGIVAGAASDTLVSKEDHEQGLACGLVAGMAYELADAMLAARTRDGGSGNG